MVPIRTITDHGNNGQVVSIECHISNSLPSIVIVGFAHRSIDEARERIRGAFANSGLALPRKRITLNLAPADIPKHGSSFDLAMVVSILCSAQMARTPPSNKTIILGEIGLDGSIHSIRGIIGKIIAAKKQGYTNFWIPYDNMHQASLIPDTYIYPFKNIKELYFELNSKSRSRHTTVHDTQNSATTFETQPLFDQVVGQSQAKRALLIAASGQHHIMMSGPPGTGKSMLAYSLLDILPPLSRDEQLDVTHIHSLITRDFDQIMLKRPLRAPHHSTTSTALLGGGQSPKPGEVTLSHHGVLLMDELPEFSRLSIESLRQPLEHKTITINRARDSIDFPAHFLLVATANPCPCGYFGSNTTCTCRPWQVQQYQKKISGPIMDRIDLYVEAEPIAYEQMQHSSATDIRHLAIDYRALVVQARQKQRTRAGKLNSELSNKELQSFAPLDKTTKLFFDRAAASIGLSARAYIRTLRVARTIADLENMDQIQINHLSEALQYRRKSEL